MIGILLLHDVAFTANTAFNTRVY